MKRLLPVLLLLGIIAAVVIFNRDITDRSDVFLVDRSGQAAWQTGNLSRAVEIYEEGVGKFDYDPALATPLAKLYVAQDRHIMAERTYRLMLEKHPQTKEGYMQYASLMLRKPERANDARNQYLLALRYLPNDPDLLRGLADVYKAAAENPDENRKKVKEWLYDWAAYYYRRSLQYDPADFETRFHLAVLHQLTERPEKAVTEYCNAMKIDPDSFEVRYNLGLTLVDLKLLDPAYRQFAKAVDILTVQNRVEEARVLAEQIQTVKNMLYYQDNEKSLPVFQLPQQLEGCLSDT